MKLKKIEIQGFKSFADKTEIKIKDGITAIVGPNGSGKSNISDAIRWVLGEQSVKNLRGSKMEDIIFAGTAKRKALGYSEVTITFDNEKREIPLDYMEIAITRRVFRSGESEYYINKNSCRLKDIRELFMDTGIGKDGYSIIGQGRIEEILSNRPEDRRNIFEEAAGIVKYKSKKEEAERKLDKTESNIIRIRDLVFELNSQLEVLEIQANKASRFRELYNRLKELEINLFIREIKKISIQINDINIEKLMLEEKLEINTREKENIEDKFNIIKKDIEDLEIQIEENRNKGTETASELDKNKSQLALIDEKNKFVNMDLKRLEEEKKNIEEKLSNIDDANVKLLSDKNTLDLEYNRISLEYNQKSKELEIEYNQLKELEKHIELEKNQSIKSYNIISDKKSELNSIFSFSENIEKRIYQLNKDMENMNEQKNININQRDRIDIEIDELEAQLLSLKDDIQTIDIIENENMKKRELKDKEINSNSGNIQAKTSSLKLFENMEADYDGYYKGVKSVLKLSKEQNKLSDGLIDVVAGLMKVDERFETAIDVSLGSNAQNIVTQTEEDAKHIIEYLKQNRLGRVTFLPLNIIKGNILNLNDKDRKEFCIHGLGHELIGFDPKYENIFKFLLGRTIIIENIDYGIKLAQRYNHSYRIVTLSGEVLNPGGSITGGVHSAIGTSIISRKNKIEKLKEDIDRLIREHGLMEEDKKILTEEQINIKRKKQKLEELFKESDYLLINKKNLKEKYDGELNRLDISLQRFQGEIENLEAEMKNYRERKKEIEVSLLDLDKESAFRKDKIKNLIVEYNENKDIAENKNKVITDMKISLNSMVDKINGINERLEENQINIKNNHKWIEEKKELIVTGQYSIQDFNNEKSELKRKIEIIMEMDAKNKSELNILVTNKNKKMEDFYSEQNRLKDINAIVGETEKQISSMDIKLAKISTQLENYNKRLMDDYEVNYDEALKYEKEMKNTQEALVETRRLKINIKELGNVNLSSIEEFKVLKERLDFILKQQKDLLDAKNSLKEVIQDIDEKMKIQFLRNFKDININFQEVFKILFNGGQAELVIEDKEDVLNSGIDIKVQPPGKKLQNLTLLSGGEKSLTAVALLFAILKLKPSPFCILDEIDAALDEANISRYTSYLKNFCEDTQFVLITHRKTTMEIADILYGVAMEEEGISKLISVKLNENMNEIAS